MKHRVVKTQPNKNDVFYKIIFEEILQFAIDDKKPLDKNNVHNINVRTVCNIFRVVPNETGQPQTMLNLSTCFPTGNMKNITCPLWKNDLSRETLNLEYEKHKFEWLVKHFHPDCFLKILNEIDPEFSTNLKKQDRIRKLLYDLEFDEQIVDDLLNGKILWPMD